MAQQEQHALQPAVSSQTIRDTKRILQVLLPGVTGPALDMCANTIFASTTASQAHLRRTSASGRFKVRRMDSGNFGEMDIFYPIGRRPSQRFAHASNLTFHYQPAEPVTAASSKQRKQST